MKLSITHTTSYSYDEPVYYGLQQVRLTPVSNRQQNVLDWAIDLEGGHAELSFQDHFKNQTLLVQVEPGQTQVTFHARGVVETLDSSGILGEVYGVAPLWYFKRNTPLTMPGKSVRKLATPIQTGQDLLAKLHDLSKSILDLVPYGAAQTGSETTAEQALAAGGGVCQDHTQIFVSAARAANVPARYVSGYLMMDDRVEQDASHAWAEAHIDGLGWVGFDVSNGISPDERYVRLATGLDSRDSSPISGMRMGSANESMTVSLQVQQ